MRLRVVAAGKLREAGLRSLVDDWAARCAARWPLRVEPVRNMAAVRATLADAAPPRVVLDERGAEPSTEELCAWLTAQADAGVREVSFFVADADGFSPPDRDAAERVLSLSRLTLAHRLALVVLVEQLYRCVALASGHPYHRRGRS